MSSIPKKSNLKQPSPPSKGNQGGVLLLIGVVVAAALILIVVASSNRNNGYAPEVSGSARLQVAQDTVDHGNVKFETRVDSTFTLRNIGDQPLRILKALRVELVEGC